MNAASKGSSNKGGGRSPFKKQGGGTQPTTTPGKGSQMKNIKQIARGK